VFCPKLCRSACPVSNAEPRETLTPWGKMSLAWMAAHGDVPVDASHGHPAWACTGCFACREACDHRNGVADALFDARDALARRGVAPVGAQRVTSGFRKHAESTAEAARALASDDRVRRFLDPSSGDALLVGCGYLRSHPAEARDAIAATATLAGGAVALVERCCGLPLRLAGDKQGFTRHASELAETLKGKKRVTVVDAGCALTLRQRYPEAGVSLAAEVELLVEQAARALPDLKPVATEPGPVRWHDPCQLSRGLGIVDAPRAVLGRALGRTPDEFDEAREWGACSGGGGLLPATMPKVSADIAATRREAHQRAGGGRIVTACGSSLRSLRSGAPTGLAVDDLVTWVARALDVPRKL
jgi:Fe-S oxidoreductase